MHRHEPGEVYYVIEGEFIFYTGGFGTPAQRIAVGVGQTVALARGTPHTIRNESDADAVAFVVHAPGAPMENFSRDAAALAADGNPAWTPCWQSHSAMASSCWGRYLLSRHRARSCS